MSGSKRVEVRRLLSDDDIAASFPVMRELRSRLASVGAYATTVRRMEREQNYRLAGAFVDGALCAVAGYRIAEGLSWGRYLYVDDLVTLDAHRSGGLGRALLSWLRDEARREGCGQLHLDSGVQRHDAHRFYLRERMDIKCFHFQQELG